MQAPITAGAARFLHRGGIQNAHTPAHPPAVFILLQMRPDVDQEMGRQLSSQPAIRGTSPPAMCMSKRRSNCSASRICPRRRRIAPCSRALWFRSSGKKRRMIGQSSSMRSASSGHACNHATSPLARQEIRYMLMGGTPVPRLPAHFKITVWFRPDVLMRPSVKSDISVVAVEAMCALFPV